MSVGYACIIEGIENIAFKTYTLKSMNNEKITNTIEHNLKTLKKALEYNIEHNIFLFRISSDIIPMASHVDFKYEWQDEFKTQLKDIGEYAIKNNIRLSMHPGQYTIINSIRQEVIDKSLLDLKYHCDFLDALGLNSTHKIILHIGGVYNDKESAINRFVRNYKLLDQKIKNRLVIENDDKFYTIEEVYRISQEVNCPVVFDNLHHKINNTQTNINEFDWINKCSKTWQIKDGRQKIHYSQQDISKRKGAHSKTIDTKLFLDFYNNIKNKNIDIMLEVKDKNISAIKCVNLINDTLQFKEIEIEWSRYKYLVLEKSQQSYLSIRTLLKDRDINSKYEFYEIVDKAILDDDNLQRTNSYEHVWGYFKKHATPKEKQKFFDLLNKQKNDVESITKLKKYLHRLSIKYNETYLTNSYFFIY
ncbi:MAG: UV DNA damage repair endonuclease UvsE [Erysipelotrichales bacterium]